MNSVLHPALALVKRQVYQSDYLTQEECTYGFHVFDSTAVLGSKCLCGRGKLTILSRGFIKLRDD